MNKREAIQAMLDGKKVRHEGVDANYLRMSDSGVIQDEDGLNVNINIVLVEGWEIYEHEEEKEIDLDINGEDVTENDLIVCEIHEAPYLDGFIGYVYDCRDDELIDRNWFLFKDYDGELYTFYENGRERVLPKAVRILKKWKENE